MSLHLWIYIVAFNILNPIDYLCNAQGEFGNLLYSEFSYLSHKPKGKYNFKNKKKEDEYKNNYLRA